MKKILSFLSIFTLIFTMCSVFFVGDASKISAEELSSCTGSNPPNWIDSVLENKHFTDKCVTNYKENQTNIGAVSIGSRGDITISYLYGISEMLIYITGIRPNEGKKENKDLNADEYTEITPQIILVSGAYNTPTKVKSKEMRSRTVHLYQHLQYGDRVAINLIYQIADSGDYAKATFRKEDTNATTISSVESGSFFDPIYCNYDYDIAGCKEYSYNEYDRDKTKAKRVEHRVDIFKKNVSGASIAEVTYADKEANTTVYQGSKNEGTWNEGTYYQIPVSAQTSFVVQNVQLIVDNSAAAESNQEVYDLIDDTIIPTLLLILGLAATVTIVVLGSQIVKSSDEPQERADKIKRLKSILIGLALAFILVMAFGPLRNLIETYLR